MAYRLTRRARRDALNIWRRIAVAGRCRTRIGGVSIWPPGARPGTRYRSGISRIRFLHSSASDAAQTSSSASITSATGVCCFTRNTPALEPPAARISPKFCGMVFQSEVTRTRPSAAARAGTSRSGTPSRFAPAAERKSIAGSRRRQPVTIELRRLASARKQITRQLCRASTCRRMRANLCLMSGGVGCSALYASSSRLRSAMSFSTAALCPR